MLLIGLDGSMYDGARISEGRTSSHEIMYVYLSEYRGTSNIGVRGTGYGVRLNIGGHLIAG